MLPDVKRLALTVVALASACGKSKAKCKQEVDELMPYLRSLDMEGSMFNVHEATHLAPRPDAPKATKYAPVVVMSAKQTTFEGQPVPDRKALTHRLTSVKDELELRTYATKDRVDPALLYFKIDSDVSWDRVVDGAEAAAAVGFDHPSFVFALPVSAQPPPRTWVEPKFEQLTKAHGNDATDIANITMGIVASCPALQAVYGSVTPSNGENKAVTIVEGTGPALLDCGCDADLPALRSVMYLLLGNPHPMGVIGVQLAKDGKPLSFPATATWGEASKQVQSSDVVWLSVK
jgi:hypothetical protein